jgi:hypothetical protein
MDRLGRKRHQTFLKKFIDDYSFEIINEWDAGGKAIKNAPCNRPNLIFTCWLQSNSKCRCGFIIWKNNGR